ncbi:hypothetical protein Trydic_g22063 [Trypoxylus dichotomus]
MRHLKIWSMLNELLKKNQELKYRRDPVFSETGTTREKQLTPKYRKLYGKAKYFRRNMRLMMARRNLCKDKFHRRQSEEKEVNEIAGMLNLMVSEFLRRQNVLSTRVLKS